MENNCCTNCTGDKEFPNTCTDPTCVCHVTPPEGGKIIAGLNHQSSDANGTTTSPRPESEPLQDVSLAEWEKRGYRIIPKEIDDLDLDWEGEHNAKRDGKWTITILKEEADLLISSLLSAREAEAYLRGKNERGIAVMGLEIDYEKKIDQAEAKVREELRKEIFALKNMDATPKVILKHLEKLITPEPSKEKADNQIMKRWENQNS